MSEEETFLKETEALHNLRALEEIEKNPSISQRELSGRLGVALGITNALLKTLVRKGLIKIRGENNRSLTYHLTHAGVLAKSRLAVQWTLNTVDFYRHARMEVGQRLKEIAADGVQSVVLYGLGELAEIAVVVAPAAGLEIKGLVDIEGVGVGGSILGLPIITDDLISKLAPAGIVICFDVDKQVGDKLSTYAKEGIRIYHLVETWGVS